MTPFAGTQLSKTARRTIATAAVAIGLVLAWTHAGFADGGHFSIGADGVVRSDAKPYPTSTPVGSYEGDPKSKTQISSTPAYSVVPTVGKKGVFLITRGGKPWATLTQSTWGIMLSDPSVTNGIVVEIVPAAKKI